MTHNGIRQGLDRGPDIRRRLRSKTGPAEHALGMLLESLRMRSMRLRGLRVLLIGLSGFPAESPEAAEASRLIASLRSMGASIAHFSTERASGAEQRADLMRSLDGVAVVFIDTDSRYVRTLRPREMRALGAEIIVPTTLAA